MWKHNAISFTKIICMSQNQKYKMAKAKTHKKIIKKTLI